MRFQTPLVPATLIRRYKRFLSDMRLADGQEVVAHCPNPGGMLGLKDPGMNVWLEPNDDPKKKLKYGWRLVEHDTGQFTGVDTAMPNRVIAEALAGAQIAELSAYRDIRPEVKYGRASRIDFLLSEPGLPNAYVEVKNVHFRRQDDWAEFPDSVTARGAKHLGELTDMAAQGHRAVMLYLVQRTDCTRFKLAADCDPTYARAFEVARAAGVQMLCYGTKINTEGVWIGAPLPVDAGPQI